VAGYTAAIQRYRIAAVDDGVLLQNVAARDPNRGASRATELNFAARRQRLSEVETRARIRVTSRDPRWVSPSQAGSNQDRGGYT
jgi:hypothetical protein